MKVVEAQNKFDALISSSSNLAPESTLGNDEFMSLLTAILPFWINYAPFRIKQYGLKDSVNIDSSSVIPTFEPKTTSSFDFSYDISEEEMIAQMVEDDYIVRMPPKEKFKLHVKSIIVKKALPPIID
jgi:hypothetical protein